MQTKSKKLPKVSIIVLNWNTEDDTIECLESIYQNNYSNYEIILVDNYSEKNSLDKIRQYCKGKKQVKSKFANFKLDNKPIHVFEYTKEEAEKGGIKEVEEEINSLPPDKKLVFICNEKNYGFSEGNNIGIRYALQKKSDYIMLLNNDTAVDKNFLVELIKVFDDKNVGVAGSKILDYYNPELIQCAGGDIKWATGNIKEYMWLKDDGSHNQIAERDFVWATSVIARREVYEKAGLLDPYFFFGIEEYDFCSRAKKLGYKILYVPGSKIWHKKGASAKKLEKYKKTKQIISKQRGFLYHKHYHRLFKKHLPPIVYLIPFSLLLLRLLTKLGVQFFKCIIKGDFARIKKGLSKWK